MSIQLKIQALLWDDSTFLVLVIDNLQQLFTKPMRKWKFLEKDRQTPVKITSPIAAHIAQINFSVPLQVQRFLRAQNNSSLSPEKIFGPNHVRQKFESWSQDILSPSPSEAVVLRAALHDHIRMALLLHEINGRTIAEVISKSLDSNNDQISSKMCSVCDGLNGPTQPGGTSFPIYCKLDGCAGQRVRYQLNQFVLLINISLA